MIKIWEKLKLMKNGIKLPSIPVKLKNNPFPSSLEKAEAFADVFAEACRVEGLPVSDRKYREGEEKKDVYKVPASDNTHYINASLTLQELKDAIQSLPSKKTSVGFDAISNEMLKNLPDNFIILLHDIFQKCWNSGEMPNIWKETIVVPVLKSGKCNTDLKNYRPIALTSHVCKLMEKIILKRLMHYCEKNKIIPVNQAGFRKGRSPVEILTKLTTNIKQQFARRQCVLATFFDITKAYDQVWHSRLLFKFKSIGLSGHVFDYVKCFLENRVFQTRIENVYSSKRFLQMGIPQGSVIAPLLFMILMHDLPSKVSKHVVLAQYADDLCMWMQVNMKRRTPLRCINYTRKCYQLELDKITRYMVENGLHLSLEKSKIVLFNNGANPVNIPTFKLGDTLLQFNESIKFLGVFLTAKLSWNQHIDYLLTKAQKSLNFLKIVRKQAWGQDSSTLIHLCKSLVRSRLTYAQEIFFSAPKHLLKNLQSIDCKSFKLALGLPMHASCFRTYNEIKLLPLDEQRKVASTKFLLRHITVENISETEIKLRSDTDFPKRAKSISSQVTLATYTSDIMKGSGIDLHVDPVSIRPSFSPVPSWELQRAQFDVHHTNLKKETIYTYWQVRLMSYRRLIF